MKSVIGATTGSASNTLAPATTVFWPLSMGSCLSTMITETPGSLSVGFGVTISKLRLYVGANSLSTATTTVMLRINGADTGVTFTIAAGATGWFGDLVNTAALVSGDTYTVRAVTDAGGSGTIEIESLVAVFDATNASDYCQVLGASSFQTASTNSSRYITSPAGNMTTTSNTSDNGRSLLLRKACTLSRPQINVSANARSTSNFFQIETAGLDNTQVIITAGLTGHVVNTSYSVARTAGQDFALWVSSGTGGGSFGWRAMAVNYVSQEGFVLVGATARSAGAEGQVRAASATPTYYPIIGSLANLSTTEARMQIPVDFNAQVSNFMLRVTNNTYSSDATVRFRINGANAVQTLTIGAGATGLFEDANLANISAGDLITWSIEGGGTGDLTFSHVALSGIEFTPASGTVSSPSLGNPGIFGGSDLSKVIRISPAL